MNDIQNDQEPSAQESGTDMGKTEVPAVPSKQNDDHQSNKLPLLFALNFSILMASKPMVMLAKAISFLHTLLKKRPRCPYTLYVVVMAMVDAAAVLFIQWSMYEEPTYADPDAVDGTTKMFNSVAGQLTKFVAQMWMEHNYVWLLNFLVLGMVYLVLVFVLNRFWVATALFSILTSIYAVANSIKVDLRNEPIIPSDLGFLSSGNGGEITSFIPKDSQPLVNGTITMLIYYLSGIAAYRWSPLRDSVPLVAPIPQCQDHHRQLHTHHRRSTQRFSTVVIHLESGNQRLMVLQMGKESGRQSPAVEHGC